MVRFHVGFSGNGCVLGWGDREGRRVVVEGTYLG